LKISIITPCLNAETTIERTIQSVLSQKGDFEHIIIDGKSTDGTLKIIRNYNKMYPKIIKYTSEMDNSMTEALNKGLKLATGDIISLLNSDDVYLKNTFEIVINTFNKQKPDVIMGNTIISNESGDTLYIRKPRFANSELAWEIMGCIANYSAVFFRKEVINKIGYLNENLKYTWDYEYFLRIVRSRTNIFHLKYDLSKFILRDEQLSSKYSHEMLEESKKYIRNPRLYSFLLKSKILVIFRILSGVYKYPSLDSFQRHLKRIFR
jgi:glycosyltransferase involved in cell wall biosynthesis